MVKGKIAHYREKLDKTLASRDLTDEKKVATLVRDQILRSTEDASRGYLENVIAKRTTDVWNFLGMLRSASENYDASPDMTHHGSWKLKQDTEELRVMYREGPEGSPFHSLLAEGYINAPLDICLCVNWETALYPRWFPETLIPTFKIVTAKCLQKVRIGEQICLVRIKLSWPLSGREALLHYFAFEYLEDGLVVVLLNTITDVDSIQMETHGFTNEGIPEAGNTVRVDLVGGFAMQKVTESRSYFRTIVTMDIKLDFVPPSLINFMSRQLIGSGFRLYQKTVASVCGGDEAFTKALNDPFYNRIGKTLLSNSESKRNLETEINQDCKTTNNTATNVDTQDAVLKEDLKSTSNEIVEEEVKETKSTEHEKSPGNAFEADDQKFLQTPQFGIATEIEEEEIKGSEKRTKDTMEGCDLADQLPLENLHKKVPISPQVEKALSTLDKLIAVVREGKLNALGWSQSGPDMEGKEARRSTLENHVKLAVERGTLTEEAVMATAQVAENGIANGDLRHADLDSHAREANSKSPVQNSQTTNIARTTPSTGNSSAAVSPMTRVVNGIHNTNSTENKKTGPRKRRICCLHLIADKLVS